MQEKSKNNRYLEKSFAPVHEEVVSECEVEGVLPEAMNGEFARNGPNSRFAPKGGYHWFDGDGMVRRFLRVGIIHQAREVERKQCTEYFSLQLLRRRAFRGSFTFESFVLP